MPDHKKCSSCGAPILFVVSAKRQSYMPLDAEPVPDGNIVVLDGKAHVLQGDLFETMAQAAPRYRSHFATCVHAAAHRKPQPKA